MVVGRRCCRKKVKFRGLKNRSRGGDNSYLCSVGGVTLIQTTPPQALAPCLKTSNKGEMLKDHEEAPMYRRR